jgi:hypothetical protein
MMPVFDLEPIRHQLHEKPLATKKHIKFKNIHEDLGQCRPGRAAGYPGFIDHPGPQ